MRFRGVGRTSRNSSADANACVGSNRFQQALQGAAHRIIVIDDRYQFGVP